MRRGATAAIVVAVAVGALGATAAAADGYRVRPGDTLAGLAGRFGVPLGRLLADNRIRNANRIYAGQVLTVARGQWRCPVRGHTHFVDDFGYVRPNGDRHEGVDVHAAKGTPVVAPVSGRLVRFPNRLGGNAFQLYGDDGVRYYGAHMDRYGQQGRVRAGTVIGYVGNTGNARGGPTHLHFEAHPGGGPAVDPYRSLRGACR